jgi:hypothetical protein
MFIGMSTLEMNCVDVCPDGTVANQMRGVCECPKFSRDIERDDHRYCECPPFSTYNEATHTCDCEGDEVLTWKGCAIDNSEDCWSRPMSYYTELLGVCTEVSTCPVSMENCMKC